MKTTGEFGDGNGHFVEAIGALARFAVEMRVPMVEIRMLVLSTSAIFRTKCVLQLPRSVVDGMDEGVLEKRGEGAENRTLIYCHQSRFKVAERKCGNRIFEGAKHQKSSRSGTDIAGLQSKFGSS